MWWFHFLTTDQQALGVLSWISTLVTIAGFGVAFAQIRKTRNAAEAAARAAAQTSAVVRKREQGWKLNTANAQMKICMLHFQQDEIRLANAYLETAFGLLVETKELSREQDRLTLSNRLVSLRQISGVIDRGHVRQVGSAKREANLHDLRTAISDLEEMAARLRYGLEAGVN